MAGLVIDATFDSGSGSFTDELNDLLNQSGIVLVVVHGPGACGPCRANDDWRNVPCEECTGNIAGRHPDSRNAEAVGNLCQCTVESVQLPEGTNV